MWDIEAIGGVQVNYNPKEASYEDLLKALFEHIDPTQRNGQGHDRGSQYRTGIYVRVTSLYGSITVDFLTAPLKGCIV